MSPEDYKQVYRLFEATRGLDAASRQAVLDRECAPGDPRRSEVESLLEHDTHASAFLESGAVEPGTAVRLAEEAEGGPDPLVGGRLGKYLVTRLVGIGGMGAVYEAEQDSPRRVVALKVMRGLCGRGSSKRFEYEAQVLARLRHPNIAQIYEAGTHTAASGERVPYFAMELVDGGKEITGYVQDAGLSVRQKLELFLVVCDAVHHGHQRAVIHRDLKPGNILVDSSGAVKVIDFGVARVTEQGAATMRTAAGQLVGTLAYMSPEQCGPDSGEGHGADIRGDVYSLGVVLYELLSGRLPLDMTGKEVPEAIRAVREDEPRRLSAVSRGLGGDLETIVRKAMEKDRARRYGSASELAGDLRRYLKDEPITARPTSVLYQCRKFARRNRALVGGVVATAAALAVGLGVAAFQAVRAGQAEERALARRDEAEAARKAEARQRQTAERVTGALGAIFESAGPEAGSGADVPVRQVLDRAIERARRELAGEPAVRARVLATLGWTYRSLGLYGEAETVVREAMGIEAGLHGEHGVAAAARRATVGLLRHDQGDARAAAELLDSAVEDLRRAGAGEELGAALDARGMTRSATERFAEARADFEEALAIWAAGAGTESAQAANTLCNLGALFFRQRAYAEAERTERRALAIRERLLPPTHPHLGQSHNNLGNILYGQGRLDGAEESWRRALGIFRPLLEENHAVVATVLGNLALVLKDRGRWDEARAMFEESLSIRTACFGPVHRTVAATLAKLGGLEADAGNGEAAEEYYRRSIAMCRRLREESGVGADDGGLQLGLQSLGGYLVGAGRYGEARGVLDEALTLQRATLGDDNTETAGTTTLLGLCMTRAGAAAEAEALLRSALEVRARRLSASHWMTGNTRSVLGECLTAQGKYQAAEAEVLEGHRVVRAALQDGHPRTREARARVAALYRAWGKPERAEEFESAPHGP